MPGRAAPDRDGAYLAVLFTALAVGVVSYIAIRQDIAVEMAAEWLPIFSVPAAALVTTIAGVLAARPYGVRRTPGVDALLAFCVASGMAAGYVVRAEAGIAELWAGMIDVTPDAVPYICAAPSPRGLFIGTGLSGHGFGIGPAVGRILADLIQGRPPGHDLSRFRFDRFSDGSPIVPGPY